MAKLCKCTQSTRLGVQ